MERTIEILQFLRKRLHFIDGLLVLLLAIEALYYAIVQAIGRDVVLLLTSAGCTGALLWCRALYLLGFLLTPLITFGFWLRLRADVDGELLGSWHLEGDGGRPPLPAMMARARSRP